MPVEILRYVGWAAYLSASATLITFVTGILFFTVGQPFGTIQDAANALQVLSMLPIALVLSHLFRPYAPGLSPLAAVVGIIGMLVAGVLQTLLVFGAVEYERTIGVVLAAGGGIGMWLALASGVLPGGLAWSGLVAGGGYIMLVVGFWLGREQHPLTLAGSLAAAAGYTVWAIWLGRAALSGAFGLELPSGAVRLPVLACSCSAALLLPRHTDFDGLDWLSMGACSQIPESLWQSTRSRVSVRDSAFRVCRPGTDRVSQRSV